MRAAVGAIGALVLAGSAAAQLGPQSPTPELGKTAPVKGGTDDGFGAGASGWARKVDSNGRMPEADYRAELARQLSLAEQMVGRSLTDGDRSRMRGAIRSDMIAWRKQYDPRNSDYRAMHERWLVDEASLSPEAWARQRVNWLRAQQEWIIANFGEPQSAEAIRAH